MGGDHGQPGRVPGNRHADRFQVRGPDVGRRAAGGFGRPLENATRAYREALRLDADFRLARGNLAALLGGAKPERGGVSRPTGLRP